MVAFWVFFSPSSILPQDELWKRIDDGLFLSEINSPQVTLIKIDPKCYSFKLLCASENNKLRMTAKKWCQKHNLISGINAGMFQADGIEFEKIGSHKTGLNENGFPKIAYPIPNVIGIVKTFR